MGIWRWLFGERAQFCPACRKRFSITYPPGRELRCSECARRLKIASDGGRVVILSEMRDPVVLRKEPGPKDDAIGRDHAVPDRNAPFGNLSVATVLVSCPSFDELPNERRMLGLCEVVGRVQAISNANNIVLLFPGGWFRAEYQRARSLYQWMEQGICPLLATRKESLIVCCGVDSHREQMGVAIDKSGIVALARKFKVAPKERHINWILAKDYLAEEEGTSRILEVKGRRLYLSVCYDDFGIVKDALPLPPGGIDAVLSLIHFFKRKGIGSGEAFYARYGLAPVSKAWCCPVFGSVVFAKDVSRDWPSGVRWTREGQPTKKSQYADFRIPPDHEMDPLLLGPDVGAIVRMYRML
jgi:hypothetical protein